MPASQQHISSRTPLGATLLNGGATFRLWAPTARAVYVALGAGTWQQSDADLLVKDERGYWSGFVPGVRDGTKYRFFVIGKDADPGGFKRDPYARELEFDGYPDCDCIVRDPTRYRWHDEGFVAPPFNDLIVYQFHFGVYYAKDAQGKDIRPGRVCKFLDVVDRIEYLADLGVNAVMPLPFQEFQTESSLGYNGTDLFSPEMDYAVRTPELPLYLPRVNQLLAAKGQPPVTLGDLEGQVNQLKTFIDLCHLYGIAVIADVVFNHAGGGFDEQSLYFLDRQPRGDNNDSLYFLRDGHAGGLVFAFWKQEVRQFLIDNGRMLLDEYHLDGLRYDQVTVIDEHGGGSSVRSSRRRCARSSLQRFRSRSTGAPSAGRGSPFRLTGWASTSATATSCGTSCARPSLRRHAVVMHLWTSTRCGARSMPRTATPSAGRCCSVSKTTICSTTTTATKSRAQPGSATPWTPDLGTREAEPASRAAFC